MDIDNKFSSKHVNKLINRQSVIGPGAIDLYGNGTVLRQTENTNILFCQWSRCQSLAYATHSPVALIDKSSLKIEHLFGVALQIVLKTEQGVIDGMLRY